MTKLIHATFLLLLCACTAQGQTIEEPECRHASAVDIQEKARFRGGPHMKITVFDGKQLEFIVQDRLRTELKSLYIDKHSVLPKDFAKRYDADKWWVLYCDEHKTVHSIVKYLPPEKQR